MYNSTNNKPNVFAYSNNIQQIRLDTVNILTNLQGLIDETFAKGVFNQKELDYVNTLIASYNLANKIFSVIDIDAKYGASNDGIN